MKKYEVTIVEDYRKTYEINAENEEEAENKVLSGIGKEIGGKTFSFEVEVEKKM